MCRILMRKTELTLDVTNEIEGKDLKVKDPIVVLHERDLKCLGVKEHDSIILRTTNDTEKAKVIAYDENKNKPRDQISTFLREREVGVNQYVWEKLQLRRGVRVKVSKPEDSNSVFLDDYE